MGTKSSIREKFDAYTFFFDLNKKESNAKDLYDKIERYSHLEDGVNENYNDLIYYFKEKKKEIKGGSVSKDMLNNISEMNFKLDISDDAVNYLGEQGYDEAYGARPLARSIQHYVEDAIADEILHGNIVEGELIKIGFDKNKEEITIKSVKQKSK